MSIIDRSASWKVLLLVVMAFGWLPAHLAAQKVVDKTVATVSDGIKTELITLSDLRWFLALQPNINLQSITSDDLKKALEVMIEQRIFALEAKRLPREPVSKEEVTEEIRNLIGPDEFPTAAALESRLRQVGFTSIDDPNFREMIENRIAIEKYVDFRFESFTVITTADETKYYRDTFVPKFRRDYPGLLMPTFEEKRTEIHDRLVQQKIATDIESFLDTAKQRLTITRLSEV